MEVLKVNELFSGIGSQRQALKRLNIPHEVVGISEIDKYAIQSYEAIFGATHNYGDISKVSKLDYADLWTYSFPCFVRGTKVLTKEGYKNIEDITIQDEVVTHKNRYRQVNKTMINKAQKIYKLSTEVSDDIYVTENHPFYVSKEIGGNLSKPEWKKVKELDESYYVSTPINKNNNFSNEILTQKESFLFWYIVGLYLNAGYIPNCNEVVLQTRIEELDEITKVLEILNLKNYTKLKDNKAYIKIKHPYLSTYLSNFGTNDKDKGIYHTVLDLSKELLSSFMRGYLKNQGQDITKETIRIESTNARLLYDIGQVIVKLYNKPFKITKEQDIEGTKYILEYDNNNSFNYYYDGDYIWTPIKKIVQEKYEGEVYNLEVAEDNSYCVQNIIVHNCTDISVAGRCKGLIKGQTRSGLLYEIERLLNTAQAEGELPKYLLLENVKNLVGKFQREFLEWLQYLEELGYNNYWKVLNAKDYGIPQNRERVFVVSIRRDIDMRGYRFPKEKPLEKTLKDMLEEEVSEKYYLGDTIASRFHVTADNMATNIIGTTKRTDDGKERIGENSIVYNPCGIIGTLVASDSKSPKQIIEYEITHKVKVRKYEVDKYRLHNELRKALEKRGISIGEIADKLGINQSTVEHWFRAEGSIPSKEVWYELKSLLGIETDYFDKSIMEFEEKDSSYEQENRCFHVEGIAPTLTTKGKVKVLEKIKNTESEKLAMKTYSNPLGDKEGKGCLYRIDEENKTIKPIQEQEELQLRIDEKLEFNYRLRHLTPLEAWRLMGQSDEDFLKAKESGISTTQLYKQAGNSIVVDVLEGIFKQLFQAEYNLES